MMRLSLLGETDFESPNIRRFVGEIFVLTAALAGCAGSPLPVQPLPELVEESTDEAAPIHGHEPLFFDREHMVWDVRWQGMSIGRAELVVAPPPSRAADALTVTSEFRTHGILMSANRTDIRLRTVIDRRSSRPVESSEDVKEGRKSQRTEAGFHDEGYRLRHRADSSPARIETRKAPGGAAVHTLHTALGVVRSWARTSAASGYLYALHGPDGYRLDVARSKEMGPDDPKNAMRIECRLMRLKKSHAPDRSVAPITFSLWLSNDDRRAPLRIAIADEDGEIAAQLIDYSADDDSTTADQMQETAARP